MQEAVQTEPVAVQPEPPAEVVPAPVRPRRESNLLASTQSLSMTIIIAVFVITFLAQAFQIPSESMEKTLLIGDYLLVDKVHYASGGSWGTVLPYRDIQRGEIIVFKYPVQPNLHFVKRVVGLPGDRIQLKNKLLYVNGKLLEEDYVVHNSRMRDRYRDDFPANQPTLEVQSAWWSQLRNLLDENRALIVPEGHYFVLGDNRDKSSDSRYWGFVPRENVVGRPLLIYWSMAQPEWHTASASLGDKLLRFAYMLTNVRENARWDRTMRVVP